MALPQAAIAVTGTIDVLSSAALVDLGGAVTITGTLTSGPACVGDRSLALEWRAADSGVYATVGEGTTDADGTFAFEQNQQHSGRYRVSAPAAGSCEAAISDPVLVRVRARVDSTLLAGSLSVGSCVEVTASVMPPKPGQTVQLERRRGDTWEVLETLTLDDGSRVSASPCFAWEDVGVVRLRVRWPAQDQVNATGTGSTLGLRIELARWMQRIADLIGRRAMSVSVGEAGSFLYERAPDVRRTPASNTKLLLSMALLDRLGEDDVVRTRLASASEIRHGVLRGDLWIVGRGDPEVDAGMLAALARRVVGLGITRVAGRVRGATTWFLHDWDAPGWHDNARDYVAMPTALAFEGNVDRRGRNVADPEERAAQALTGKLEKIGVSVRRRPGQGTPPRGAVELASVASRPLRPVLARMLRPSDNFYAEMLGKRLGAHSGPPGTIAKGAAAIEAWVSSNGVSFDVNDNSGLSYANRVSTHGIVRLLWVAEAAAWGPALFAALPSGGQGTLRHRFATVQVRAKTGTLTDISALSGWVWLERLEGWGEFSILSSGMPKYRASELEDKIVRILQNHAR
ncbi:MAG TPA: D-alanyl-D-alanine carboxypeptidase [Actinomycetota bacterium]|nr:D-alanyl-D-alanine carboxypeptidase [Actinomycetota bacterium]